jgi:hypothetical protein
MVVPFAAGGATDIVARLLSPRLSELLGQQVIVENVGGAGGTTGTARVAKAPPDGYQFVLGNVGTHAHNQTLYRKPPYDAVRDFAPVVLIADLSIVLLTRKDFPADNLPEFIAYGKANEAKLQYGSAGAGSSTHLACVLLNAAIGITVTHVPYRGGTPAMQDLLAGRIDYQCPTTSTATAQIEGKTAKGLATLTRNRTALLRGKTVVVDAPDTAFAILLYKMLGVGGLKKDDYKVKPVGGTPLRLDAMLKDKANAAAMLNPPFSIKAESEGLKSLGWAIDVVGPYQSGAAWVMRSWAQGKPRHGRKVPSGVCRGNEVDDEPGQ